MVQKQTQAKVVISLTSLTSVQPTLSSLFQCNYQQFQNMESIQNGSALSSLKGDTQRHLIKSIQNMSSTKSMVSLYNRTGSLFSQQRITNLALASVVGGSITAAGSITVAGNLRWARVENSLKDIGGGVKKVGKGIIQVGKGIKIVGEGIIQVGFGMYKLGVQLEQTRRQDKKKNQLELELRGKEWLKFQLQTQNAMSPIWNEQWSFKSNIGRNIGFQL